jgi:phosphatase NudJ
MNNNSLTCVWKPSVTVAAVVSRNGSFLMVEEQTEAGIRLNQPAGHLEEGESLEAAVIRETLEESAFRFTPDSLLGVYLGKGANGITYLRFAYTGTVAGPEDRALDEGIIRALWLRPEQLRARAAEHRSPLVLRCVEDALRGQRFPLDAVFTHPNLRDRR